MWAFDLPEDHEAINSYSAPFRERGARILLELNASLQERLRRNSGEFRLAEKPSKRDRDWSRRNLLSIDGRYQLNTQGEFDGREDWLRIDNTSLSPDTVAELTIDHFKLTRINDATR
jgi:hypothetical protein